MFEAKVVYQIDGWKFTAEFKEKFLIKLSSERIFTSEKAILVLSSGVDKNGLIERFIEDFDAYMEGKQVDFLWLDLFYKGYSAFYVRVWEVLRHHVRWGEVITYGDLSDKLGLGRGGARAVGMALKKNPFLIVVPCHRVIKADGSIGNFSAGVELKKYLLKKEKIIK